jgi:DNA-binding transcriptional LysR family regulator
MLFMYDWGDLKFFLGVARAGSTLAAARELGVNQTTVARRIAALEVALDARLFDRNQEGYRLSEAGSAIVAHAERVAAEAESLERLVAQRRRQLSGVIRVTTAELIANLLLTPWLADFIEVYPDIRVEVVGTDAHLNIARGDADVAIRAGVMPTGAGIVVRKLADAPWGLYCSKSYASKRGKPSCADELKDHVVIGVDGPLAKMDLFAWFAAASKGARIRNVSTTVGNLASAVKAGNGVGLLPLPMGFSSEFVECFKIPQFNYGYYLVTRESLKDVPRIKAFNEFIIGRAMVMKQLIEGRRSRAA